MICEAALAIVCIVISCVFMIVGTLPAMPEAVISVVDSIFDLMFDGFKLLTIFVDVSFLKIVFPVAILIIEFDKIYGLVMWIIKKIPFLDMK